MGNMTIHLNDKLGLKRDELFTGIKKQNKTFRTSIDAVRGFM